MPVVFANPAGFWALLALPVIVLIHFLQRELRQETCTTLFLLESLEREGFAGNRFEWLKQSPPLWLQLLCALLLTWVLVEPRWLRAGSVQPVAFVLDSSASMQAFAADARRQLLGKTRALSQSASRTEFVLLDSSSPGPALYHGESPESLAASLDAWVPSRGLHDFTPALRIARNTVGRQGLVVLVTDHPAGPLPFDARLLSVGTPLPNAGFAGLQVQETEQGPLWKALVRNYSSTPQNRQLSFSSNGQVSPVQDLALAPGEIRTLTGPFPNGVTELVLHLTPDSFPLDDVLPVLVPRQRILSVSSSVSDRSEPLVESLRPAFSPAEILARDVSKADLVIQGYDPLVPSLPAISAVVFVDRAPRQSSPQAALLAAANHPLTEDLRWEALIVRPDIGIPFRKGDTALLWLDAKPLIWLRNPPGCNQLVFNFDLASSNAAKLPAFVLLLHRFADLVRQRKASLESRLAETHQIIELPAHSTGAACTGRFMTWDGRDLPLPFASASPRVALPGEPGFASVQLSGQPLLRLAAHFADTREADLSQSTPVDEVGGILPGQVLRYSEASLLAPLWILLAAAALLASWAWQKRG